MCALPAAQVRPTYAALPQSVREFFDDQYRRAYQLVADARHPVTGLYRDAYVTQGQEKLPSSIAATGVGLIALAIGDYEGWESEAADKAVLTLRAMAGELPGLEPAKDQQTGFFAHFIDIETGARFWNSENSTIDTALLVSGALFAREYFRGHREIHRLAVKLYHSVRWEAAIASSSKGEVFLKIEQGRGVDPLAPYNEYSLLAYLARSTSTGKRLWQQVYSPERLHLMPQQLVGPGRSIICEEGNIPSSFVYQFPYYLVHDYTISPVYNTLYANIAFADRLSWVECHKAPTFVWGHGAGVTPTGYYHPDSISDNPEHIASPYIIAGFLPVYPRGIYDLYDIYRTIIPYDKEPAACQQGNQSGSPTGFQDAYRYGLSRFQYDPEAQSPWYPEHTSVIDWSSMLYGLTAFKHGTNFFANHNRLNLLALAS
ncbi:MAG: hypothetical protein GX855_07825 [Firmicutes bacterium]|nr:hypothetical protein [Bacillota bacterium]